MNLYGRGVERDYQKSLPLWWLIYAMSYKRVFRAKTRKVATRKPACSPLFVVSLPGGAKRRHAKRRQMVILAGFRVATFRPTRQRYDKQEAKRRRMKSVVLACGGAKGRHAKTRKSHNLVGFRVAPFRRENTIIRNGTNQPPYFPTFPSPLTKAGLTHSCTSASCTMVSHYILQTRHHALW